MLLETEIGEEMVSSVLRQGIRILSRGSLVAPLSEFYHTRVVGNLFVSHLIRNVAFNVQGHRMFLDREDNLVLLIRRVYEPCATAVVRTMIKEGDVVLDIGAHIGYFTLIFAEQVGESGRVFAFEPNPTNFALLRRNVTINQCENVTLVQKAVSDKNGKVRLYLTPGNTAVSSIIPRADSHGSIEVEAVRLDDYLRSRAEQIDLIKMDIEGAEMKALQGLSLLLHRNRDVKIVSEFWPFALKRSGVGADEYLHLLTRHGFRLYNINEQKRKLESAEIDGLLRAYTPEKRNFTNLLCAR